MIQKDRETGEKKQKVGKEKKRKREMQSPREREVERERDGKHHVKYNVSVNLSSKVFLVCY